MPTRDELQAQVTKMLHENRQKKIGSYSAKEISTIQLQIVDLDLAAIDEAQPAAQAAFDEAFAPIEQARIEAAAAYQRLTALQAAVQPASNNVSRLHEQRQQLTRQRQELQASLAQGARFLPRSVMVDAGGNEHAV